MGNYYFLNDLREVAVYGNRPDTLMFQKKAFHGVGGFPHRLEYQFYAHGMTQSEWITFTILAFDPGYRFADVCVSQFGSLLFRE